MRALACLLVLTCLAAPAVGLAQATPPGAIEGSRLQCNGAPSASQSTCSLTSTDQTQAKPPVSPATPEKTDRTLTIPMQRTPNGGLQPEVQADGEPFRLVCEPKVEGQVQRCSARPRPPAVGQPT